MEPREHGGEDEELALVPCEAKEARPPIGWGLTSTRVHSPW